LATGFAFAVEGRLLTVHEMYVTERTDPNGLSTDYEYDSRYRLTKAERNNSGDTITAAYQYTYNDGDNLLTRVTPFFDDFNDGDYNGWTVTQGSWGASNGYLSATGSAQITKAQSEDDVEVHYRYYRDSSSADETWAVVYVRMLGDASTDHLRVKMNENGCELQQRVNSSDTTLDTSNSGFTEDTWYDVYVKADGCRVEVWKGLKGGDLTKVLSTSSASMTTSDNFMLNLFSNNVSRFDNARVVSDALSTTTTLAYDDANELTSMTVDNGTTNFHYDAWGRMVSKDLGSYDATYEYRYGNKLYRVTSNTFPDEGDVSYKYSGDGKRRRRTAGGAVTKYKWDAGWTVINEEDSQGTLTRTYVGRLGDVAGSDPANGDYRYYFRDHLGSTRRLLDDSKNTNATYEFTPYGQVYAHTGETTTRLFTGHDWDATAGLYFAPYRYYNPTTARWLTRDPLGMIDGPNVYAYVMRNPVGAVDPLGLSITCVKKTGCFCPWHYRDVKWTDTSGQVWCCHYIDPDKCENCFSKYGKCMIKAGTSKPLQDKCMVTLSSCVYKHC